MHSVAVHTRFLVNAATLSLLFAHDRSVRCLGLELLRDLWCTLSQPILTILSFFQDTLPIRTCRNIKLGVFCSMNTLSVDASVCCLVLQDARAGLQEVARSHR